jgi:hypothetical protein
MLLRKYFSSLYECFGKLSLKKQENQHVTARNMLSSSHGFYLPARCLMRVLRFVRTNLVAPLTAFCTQVAVAKALVI